MIFSGGFGWEGERKKNVVGLGVFSLGPPNSFLPKMGKKAFCGGGGEAILGILG